MWGGIQGAPPPPPAMGGQMGGKFSPMVERGFPRRQLQSLTIATSIITMLQDNSNNNKSTTFLSVISLSVQRKNNSTKLSPRLEE